MRPLLVSSTRKFALWYFDEPSNDPYVSLNFDVEVAAMRGFIDAVEREHGVRVGLHHVVTKAVARCLKQMPPLNVKILSGKLHQLERVDIAMPVHLGANKVGKDETALMVVHDVDQKSIVEVARHTRKGADDERQNKMTLGGTAVARAAARFLPQKVLRSALDGGRMLLSNAVTYRMLADNFGVSSGVTNVGAVFSLPKGARFRSASATISSKLGHVASVFGIAPTEDAAIVDNGEIVAKTVMPIVMIVDHRAIDGVLMATAASRLCELLLNPAELASSSVLGLCKNRMK